jgi:phosphotransferase system enzyme I (PtsP)
LTTSPTAPGRARGSVIPDRSNLPTADRSTLLADVASIVSRSHDLDETLDNVVDLVAKRLDADVCSIYLTEPDLRHLLLSATMGLDKSAVSKVRLALGEGLVGLVASQREPEAWANAKDHPAYRYFPQTGEERYHSLMAAPLIVGGMATMNGLSIGVLVVQTLQRREFSSADLDLLNTCARLIAPVVMNSQLLALVSGSAEARQRVVAQLERSGVEMAGEPPRREERNVEVRGSATSRGIAIGPVYFLEDSLDLDRVEYTPQDDPEAERRDLFDALDEARRELHDLRDDVGTRFGPDFAAVFNTHIQILEDKGFVSKVEVLVRGCGNALEALRGVLAEYAQMFGAIEDPFFRERGSDVNDVGHRVIAKLLGVRHHNIPLSEGAVVVASNLAPAHFALLETEKIAAIVSEHGGPTSHGAIFARALEIPAVTGAAGILRAARPGEQAVVDGESGRVYLSPDDVLLREYQLAQHRAQVAVEHLDALAERPAETRDGRRILLTANVGLLSDLPLCERHGAEGIGLFRTELLALVHRGFPSEDDQEKLYEGVAEAMAPRQVTIRTLDLGGDKAIPNLGLELEENPQLGCRSIRLSLFHLDAFRAQLRAILRASAQGNVRLLIPMISSVDELRTVREIIDETREELGRRGARVDSQLPVGVMVEVPSAAMIADVLARECDFFSIGTNDLTQYTLAVDRGNERVASLYDPLHPGVLSLIDRTVRAASRAGIPVSLCGEMASNPLAVPILVGLGLGELSGVASAIPVVKEIIRELNRGDVEEDARRALEAASAVEVHRIAADRLREAGLLEHRDIGDWLMRAIERHTGEPARG